LPPAADEAQQPPDIARWMSRADGCSECVTNVEPPRDVKATADGWMAAYLCSDCGHAWLTSWRD
jgi:hypothetical protein